MRHYHKYRLRLHDHIHSQLIGSNSTHIQSIIGLEEICDGCLKCSNIAQKCLEYGPMRFNTLQTLKNSKIYKKLHVSDKLFEDIAEYCISKSNNKMECFKELDNTVPSTVSCDTLVIWINESRILPNEEAKPKYDHRHMPREVIDLILKKWNVKSVKLNMIYYTNESLCSVEWIQNYYFTPVRLNDAFWTTEKPSDLKFSHVKVRMSDSTYCVKEFGYYQSELQVPRGYNNFISNIRRMFPTDKISIDLSHWYSIASTDIEKKMSTILDTILTEKQDKLKVNMTFFVKAGSVKNLHTETKTEKLFGVAHGFCPQENRLRCYKRSLPFDLKLDSKEFIEEKWIGRRFQVENAPNQFNFNLDVYIKDNELKEEVDKELLKDYPNSFVGHFC